MIYKNQVVVMSMRHPVKQMIEKMSNDELIEMLRRGCIRKLTKYRLTDEFFRKKYGMTYEEFENENVVAKKNFSWEVDLTLRSGRWQWMG